MSSMTQFPRTTCILANVLLAGGILLFAAGFFPHKAFLPGLAAWPAEQDVSSTAPPFDKVIFMVVDALRSDFVYSSNSQFLFMQSLIRSGAAVPFDGHASPPTITMPRIKAITTGSVPSFLDAVLNFAESDTTSTLAHQDSWLAQSKAKLEEGLVMYGDDTWLKLFPGFFKRAEGTTSFFVSDFTEVDQNVTRHIPTELAQKDWSVMILHYLGLDHIGHKTGPQSRNMAPKQKEMDEIVETIYHAMEHTSHLNSSLLVVCGDHGMNEAGNHGGSSSGEVTAALTFISPKFKAVFDGLESPKPPTADYSFYEKVEQSDITPTLASLLGFPVPLNNLGVMVMKMLDLWMDDLKKLELLYLNARQIASIANATYSEAFRKYNSTQACSQAISEAGMLSCAWLEVCHAFQATKNDKSSAAQAIILTWDFLRAAQKLLSGTASNYDLVKMSAGVAVTVASLLLAVIAIPHGTCHPPSFGAAFTLTVLCHSVTMFASSYVEEEHQFWYWILSGWLIYLCVKAQRLSHCHSSLPIGSALLPISSFLFGITRHVNSPGQKFAALPSISSAVFPAESWLLWSSTLVEYAVILQRLTRRASTWGGGGSSQLSLLPIPVCIAALAFKVAFTHADSPELLKEFPLLSPLVSITSRYSLIGQARVVMLGIAHMLACALYYEAPWTRGRRDKSSDESFLYSFHNLLTLFLMTQSRITNVPVFLLFSIQLSCLCAEAHLFSNMMEIILTSLLFQQSSFFALGGTNTISSIDLSNAYNGISGYNVLLVGILTFVSNWAGPIWWVSGTTLLIGEKVREDRLVEDSSPPTKSSAILLGQLAAKKDSIKTEVAEATLRSGFLQFSLLTTFMATSTLSVMVACTLLREHLFIWTVFSPKYLYVGAWVFGHHILVNGFIAWGLLGKLSTVNR